MGMLDSLLGRLGYVRLNQYGLVKTPEGRIVTLHRRVLDDGAGGRVIGWRAEDPAPMALGAFDLVPRAGGAPSQAARSAMARSGVALPGVVPPRVRPPSAPRPRRLR